MSPIALMLGGWMLVIGYALVYIGYSNLILNKSVSFASAFGLNNIVPKTPMTSPSASMVTG